MHGLIAGSGKYYGKIKSSFTEALPGRVQVNDHLDSDSFSCLTYRPVSRTEVPGLVKSPDGTVSVLADGYVIYAKSFGTQKQHLERIATDIARHGVHYVIGQIVAGSFNLVVYHHQEEIFYLVNDRMGANPLFYLEDSGDLLFCTHLSFIRKLLERSAEANLLASAAFVFFGHCINNHTFLRGVRQLPPGSLCTVVRGKAIEISSYVSFGSSSRSEQEASPDDLIPLFRQSCARIFSLEKNVSNLQSAGMDSRLITASWPAEGNLDCYTYGHPDSYEVEVARQVVHLRGGTFRHIRPSGSEVAEILDQIFNSVDNYIYPDRYFVSEAMAQHGARGVLDGYLGDVLLGGTYFSNDKYQNSRLNRAARFFTVLRDIPLKELSLEEVSESLFHEMKTIKEADLDLYFASDFGRKLKEQKKDLLQEIFQEVTILEKQTDSLSVLYRNYKLLNRARMSIVKQGVVCRNFLEAYYPFTNDYDFLDHVLQIPPEKLAYRKLYINLFKKHYPGYADIPLGSSQIALKHPAYLHKWSMIALKKGIRLPLLNRNPENRQGSPNNWSAWLAESAALRRLVLSLFENSPYGNYSGVKELIESLEETPRKGTGKILHVTGVLNWLSLTRR